MHGGVCDAVAVIHAILGPCLEETKPLADSLAEMSVSAAESVGVDPDGVVVPDFFVVGWRDSLLVRVSWNV